MQLANIIANDHLNRLLLSEERKIFKNIYNERLNRIEELTKKIITIIYITQFNAVVMKIVLLK